MALSPEQFEGLSADLHDPNVGGFTVSPRTGRRPTSGISVAMPQYGQKASLDAVDAGTLQNYASDRSEVFGHQRHFMGGWADGGNAYLDTVKLHNDSAQGQTDSRHHLVQEGEIASFNLKKFSEDRNPFHPEGPGPDMTPPERSPEQVNNWASATGRSGGRKRQPREGESFS